MTHKEIGSEFFTIETKKHFSWPLYAEKKSNVEFYLSGRSALDGIIKDICSDCKKHSVALPAYCCDSMIIPFIDNGIEVSFYDVIASSDGVECYYDYAFNGDIVFVIDYFGYKNKKNPITEGKIVIKDCTHSIFRDEIWFSGCDYAFASFRKWSALDFGVAVKNSSEFLVKPQYNSGEMFYISHRQAARNMKKAYVENGCGNKSSFLEMFSEAENDLESSYHNASMYCMNWQDSEYACFDFELVKNKRYQNAKYLIEGIQKLENERIKLLNPRISLEDSPLFVPIIVESRLRSDLRCFFIDNDIYTPVHWPLTDYHKISNKSKVIYDTELSLICDQRYNIEDMARELSVLEDYLYKL